MQALKAHVENGRIVVDDPVDLPEGTKLEVYVGEPDDDMSEQERAELLRSIDDGLEDVDAGDVREFKEVVSSLGTRR